MLNFSRSPYCAACITRETAKSVLLIDGFKVRVMMTSSISLGDPGPAVGAISVVLGVVKV
jgi:hypothetical protein